MLEILFKFAIMHKKILHCFSLFIILHVLGNNIVAQNVKNDSISKDSVSVKSFFVDNFNRYLLKKKSKPAFVEDLESKFIDFEDLIINDVKIIVLKPFNVSKSDSVRFLEKLELIGNKLHSPTSEAYVERFVPFKKGNKVSCLEMAETERLLRTFRIFNDVSIHIVKNNDSTVDVYIVCEDTFSLGAEINTNFINRIEFIGTNRNLWGVAHELEGGVGYNSKDSVKMSYLLAYNIRNIRRTYIDFTARFNSGNKARSFYTSLKRNFTFTTTKFAGLLSYKHVINTKYIDYDTRHKNNKIFNYDLIDIWLGRAHNIYSNRKGIYQIINAVSYTKLNTHANPIDPRLFNYYMDTRSILFSSQFCKRQYLKSNYIHGLGETEDITDGYKCNVTIGREKNELADLLYLGGEFSKVMFFKRSMEYIAYQIKYGGYFNRNVYERGSIRCRGQVITKLYRLFRQRARFEINGLYSTGIERYKYDFMFFNDYLRDFSSKKLMGTQKLSFQLTQNLYFPYMKNGNRMSSYVFTDFGWITNSKSFIFNSKPYYGIGIGFKINNEKLIFKTLNLRLTYYPRIPSDINRFNIIAKNNRLNNYINLGFEKPSTIGYK